MKKYLLFWAKSDKKNEITSKLSPLKKKKNLMHFLTNLSHLNKLNFYAQFALNDNIKRHTINCKCLALNNYWLANWATRRTERINYNSWERLFIISDQVCVVFPYLGHVWWVYLMSLYLVSRNSETKRGDESNGVGNVILSGN